MLMSILRKSRSLRVIIQSLVITNKEYYELFDFKDPQIKYLTIQCDLFPYPINKFQNNGWALERDPEFNRLYGRCSVCAYALFMFLVHSNFIYSLDSFSVICSGNSNLQFECMELFQKFKREKETEIICGINSYYSPNLTMISPELVIKYRAISSNIYSNKYNEVSNNELYNKIPYGKVDNFIYNCEYENFSQTKEIIDKIYAVQKHFYINISTHLPSIIENGFYLITCNSFEDTIYEFCITIFRRKFDLDIVNKIIPKETRKEELCVLQEQLNSQALGITLEKGTLVKKLTFSNCFDSIDTFNFKSFCIDLISNTFTIFCKYIDCKMINFK